MSAFSNYLEEAIVKYFLQCDDAQANPTSTFLALFTNSELTAGTATDATTFAEPTYNAYARKAITFTNYAAGVTKNVSVIGFDANDEASPVTITGIGVYDAETDGNLLLWSKLVTAKELAQGDTISFAANAIQFTID